MGDSPRVAAVQSVVERASRRKPAPGWRNLGFGPGRSPVTSGTGSPESSASRAADAVAATGTARVAQLRTLLVAGANRAGAGRSTARARHRLRGMIRAGADARKSQQPHADHSQNITTLHRSDSHCLDLVPGGGPDVRRASPTPRKFQGRGGRPSPVALDPGADPPPRPRHRGASKRFAGPRGNRGRTAIARSVNLDAARVGLDQEPGIT
jgi:hypothetical protein